MKLLWLLTVLIMGQAHAQLNPQQSNFSANGPYVDDTLANKRDKLLIPEDLLNYADLNVTEVKVRNSETVELRKIKYYILNGETRLAHLYLDKLNYTDTNLKPIIYRYQGVLNFIEGKFERSLNFLNRPSLSVIPHYSKICILKVLNRIVLSKVIGLGKEWERCQHENSKNLNFNNLAWLTTLIELKLRPVDGATSVPFRKLKLASLNVDELRTFLKMALYLNQQAIVVKQFLSMEEDQVADAEVRELMSHLFFRSGELAQSYKFMKGISSPNTENMRGNLYLMQKKYELAYAQFKLALELKQNSQNALERLLPLAWIMKDWDKGFEYAERVVSSPQTHVNKLTIMTAFLIQSGKYEEARDLLNVITQRSRFGYHLDAAQISSYVALQQNSSDAAKKNAKASCEQLDMVYCWVAMQLENWEAFALTAKRTEKIIEKTSWEKLTEEEINEPLKEVVYVNQLDVEELDDSLIKLSPKAAP